MAIDLQSLASVAVTAFMIPYAKNLLQSVGEQVKAKVGDAAAKYATEITDKVWNKVKSIFSAPQDEAILSQFEARPDAGKDLLIDILKDKLAENPEFAEELNKLINSPGPNGLQSGAQIMSAGIAGIVDARGMTLSGSGNQITGLMFDNSSKQTLNKSSDQNK